MKSRMDMGTPALRMKNLPESDPPKSRCLVLDFGMS